MKKKLVIPFVLVALLISVVPINSVSAAPEPAPINKGYICSINEASRSITVSSECDDRDGYYLGLVLIPSTKITIAGEPGHGSFEDLEENQWIVFKYYEYGFVNIASFINMLDTSGN